ncbi:hypothetical protein NU688_31680 [Variovorax sp. ZS18.2.2]|uniref:hypothetical protein n=1 Tax=Variovorax sp. ZS18.2.2 TaxID=2971255 RepID=UPI002150E83F|nr:hypothetical protein [Variovorax sp. ZS18.2.2]MCR6480753.1 hypothetical protein [Variovorax sp. ZS18.2.2]
MTESEAQSSSPALQALSDEPAPSFSAQIGDNAGPDLSGAQARLDAPDPRNGSYAVYAANGTQLALSIDMNAKRYVMTDPAGESASGTFAEDFTEPGTYVFDTTRVPAAVNLARFRITADAAVGQFPFANAYSNPATYAVQPFIAARTFVTAGAAVDGVYNRLGISHNRSGTTDSQVVPLRISGTGTLLEMCFDNTIYTIDACPTGSKRAYSLAVEADSKWTGTNVTNPDDKLGFRVTRINGQNVYLSAGASTIDPDTQVFRLAVPESSSWPAITTRGGSTVGTWGRTTLDTTTYLRAASYADDNYKTLNVPVSPLASGPAGIRVVTNGTEKYHVVQGAGLAIVAGFRTIASTVGYIAVGLVDSRPPGDSRNGRYKVFTTNGTQQTLKLNLDTKRYEMIDNAGATVAGAIADDSAEAGTYIFATGRVANTPYNTARFRVSGDAVVGGFPFAVALSNPVTYAAQPFIAARTFVTRAADLDGTYSQLAVTRNASGADSSITSFRLQGGGTGMVLCNSNQIFAIDACPAQFQIPYTVTWDAANARWQAIRVDNPDPNQGQIFHVARIGGQNIQLRGAFGVSQASTIFRIGLPEMTLWPSVTAHGLSTDGAWGSSVLNTEVNQRTSTSVNGTVGTLSLPVSILGGPSGMRIVNGSGVNKYFEVRSTSLSVLVGARTNVNTQGYIQLNLVD